MERRKYNTPQLTTEPCELQTGGCCHGVVPGTVTCLWCHSPMGHIIPSAQVFFGFGFCSLLWDLCLSLLRKSVKRTACGNLSLPTKISIYLSTLAGLALSKWNLLNCLFVTLHPLFVTRVCSLYGEIRGGMWMNRVISSCLLPTSMAVLSKERRKLNMAVWHLTCLKSSILLVGLKMSKMRGDTCMRTNFSCPIRSRVLLLVVKTVR